MRGAGAPWNAYVADSIRSTPIRRETRIGHAGPLQVLRRGSAPCGRPSSSGCAGARTRAHDGMTKRSTKRPSSPRSRNTRQSIAPLRRRVGSIVADRAQEFVAVLGIDPVFDLDQHRAVVGQRLDGDGEIRQLHARRDVGLVAHRDADAAVHREQQRASRRPRRQARCACRSTTPARPRSRCPTARLAWPAIRFIETARARTQAGAALCVPRRQAGQHADPRGAAAARADEREHGVGRRRDEQRRRRPTARCPT